MGVLLPGCEPYIGGVGWAGRQFLDVELCVALENVVDVDVTPSAFVTIDDLDHGLLIQEPAHVLAFPCQLFAATGTGVRAGCGLDHFAIHNEVDACQFGVASTSDQKVNPFPLDTKRR